MHAPKTDGTASGPRESSTPSLGREGVDARQTVVPSSSTSDAFHLTRALWHLADVAPAVGQSSLRNLPRPTTVPPAIPRQSQPTPTSAGSRKRRYDDEMREADAATGGYLPPAPRSTDARPVISPIATGSYHELPRAYAPPALDTMGYSQFYPTPPYSHMPYPGYPPWMPAVTVSYPSPRFTPRHAAVQPDGRFSDAGFSYQTVSSLYGVPISPLESPPPGVTPFFRQDVPSHHPGLYRPPPLPGYAAHPSVFSHMPLPSPYMHPEAGALPVPSSERMAAATSTPLSQGGPSSLFHPITADEEVNAPVVEHEGPRPEPKAYRCRKCGEPKRGHTCRVLHRTPPPDTESEPFPPPSSS